ncbi:phosphoenolpyruvate carboxykinase (ATP) [Paramaledivibacter caminithermalis]|jgi:hypothetical protein|uniref:HprK-related kinase B n=1 Tax=Paramaledivibacter caminithermalis (strain DSM 15212 / CIP 107654 / DViRD3) TaxID=1121301 RepID=A0A1M6QG19_PARC5|nr:hypothetical protein [Paramaledivibacter caminithermalis]SHK19156.1 hypothetical protein SAMN02745912_02561 [Paramaledivibacter caminithermalis DSM 15212]
MYNLERIYEIEGITFGVNIGEGFDRNKIHSITEDFLYGIYTIAEDTIKPQYEITIIKMNDKDIDIHIKNIQQLTRVKYLGFHALISKYPNGQQRIVYFPDLMMLANYSITTKKLLIQCYQENEWVNFYIGWMIRELLRTELLCRGKIFIHSSGIELYDKAVLLCGKKGSGKTSSLMEMLDKGFNLIANDQVIVASTGENFMVSCFPMFVGIGIGTLSRFPRFNQWLNDYSNLIIPQYKLVRHKREVDNSFSNEKKLLLVIRELLEKFPSSNFSKASMLKAIIKVEFDNGLDYAKIFEITRVEEKQKILEENLKLENDDVFTDIFGIARCDRQQLKSIKQRLINKVKFYNLKQNLQCIGSYQKIIEVVKEMR